MPRFTPEQRAAIEARGEDLLVAAAAGSGKTTVLVERVLALIAEGVDVDRVCIVTFTRAAAADMREKLQRRLEASSGADERMRAQLDRLPLATIGTLHSFCAALIRERFEAAGVDPAFRILDGPEAERMQAAALREAMDEVYAAASPSDLAVLTCGRGADAVAGLAAALYRFIRNRPDPFGWLDAALASCDAPETVSRCLAILEEDVRAMAREAAALAASAAAICETPGGPFHYGEPLRADARLLGEIVALPGAEMARALSGFKPTRPGKARKDEFDEELLERVKRLRDAAKAAAARAADAWIDPEEAARDLAANRPALALLAGIVRSLDRRLEAEKDERGVCDYADLEHRALRALADGQVRASVASRYDAVFVDEYQDISDVQESVIRAAARPGRLFMVGDVKQSIYRFRLAEPNLFLRKQRAFAAGEGGRLIALNRNFRSRANILRFTNEVFFRAMRGEGSEMEYAPEDALVPGAEFPGPDPLVEIALLSGEGEAIDEGPVEEDGEGDARAAEGLFIARRVRELLGTPLFDPREGRERPLRYRDMVVLARTRQRLLDIRDVLEKEGVPCFADAGNAYADSMEVRHMLSLLTLVANGRSDTALLAALLAPGSGFGAEDVAAIRIRCPKGSFRDACDACASSEDELAGRLRRFFETLARWRLLARSLPLDHLVDLLLRETGFYAYAGALAGGERRRANLDLLCDLAAGYEAAHGDGLTGFLGSLRMPRGGQAEQGEAQALGEGDDVVRLMTVHKSKGLEFPVVFGAQLERDFAREGGAGELAAHKSLGFGLEMHDGALGTRRDTALCLAARSLARLENVNEELRLLYVLLTRASDRLILTGRVKDIAASRARWQAAAPGVRGLRTWLDALAPAVPGLAALENGEADVTLRVYDAVSLGRPGALRAGAGSAASLAALEDALEAPAAPDPVLDASYSWEYPFAQATLSPLKVTVTALAREAQGPAERAAPPAAPDFLSGEKRAMERGSAVHAALSALDLAPLRGLAGEALRGEITCQLDAFAAEGILRREMRAAVRPDALARFFEGPLGRRMLAAGSVRREWPFNLRMPSREALDDGAPDTRVLVQGVIDCCFLEGGRWVLLDYKTDADDDEQALLAHYAPQLRLYRRALEEITGLGVAEAWLCLLRGGRALPVE